MRLHGMIANNAVRSLLYCCSVMLVNALVTPPAGAQADSSVSRWSVGIHLGEISNNNTEAMRLGVEADSLAPLDVGLKDALRSGVSVDYDVWHVLNFGLSVGGFYSQSSLDFGLVDSRTGLARHLGDATLRLAAVTASYDLGDHALFETPDHNNFLLVGGLIVGKAWLSAFTLDGQTSSELDLKEVATGSELIFGVQSRVLWRVDNSRWVFSFGGAFLRGGGDSFLMVRAGPTRGNASVTSAMHFALLDCELRYRL